MDELRQHTTTPTYRGSEWSKAVTEMAHANAPRRFSVIGHDDHTQNSAILAWASTTVTGASRSNRRGTPADGIWTPPRPFGNTFRARRPEASRSTGSIRPPRNALSVVRAVHPARAAQHEDRAMMESKESAGSMAPRPRPRFPDRQNTNATIDVVVMELPARGGIPTRSERCPHPATIRTGTHSPFRCKAPRTFRSQRQRVGKRCISIKLVSSSPRPMVPRGVPYW